MISLMISAMLMFLMISILYNKNIIHDKDCDFNNDVFIDVYNDLHYDIIDIYDVVDLVLFLGDDLGNVSVYNVVNNLS